MILRSLPITDFSPGVAVFARGCGLRTPAVRAVRGSSAGGSAEELRVNIKPPSVRCIDRTYINSSSGDGRIVSAGGCLAYCKPPTTISPNAWRKLEAHRKLAQVGNQHD